MSAANPGSIRRVALVTGGGSGIGQASARALAAMGAHVVIADREVRGADETVALVDADGGTAEARALDVTAVDDVDAVVARIVEEHGRLDWAHNNAGVFANSGSFLDTDDATFDRLMGVNLKGIWACMRAELAIMRRQGHGSIVNTASAAGVIGTPGTPAYSASKHGVVGLTRSAAREFAMDGVRVNAVCPGSVNTPMLAGNLVHHPEVLEQITRMQPNGRLAEPGEIAASVAWLCSDEASYVSGAALLVTAAGVNR